VFWFSSSPHQELVSRLGTGFFCPTFPHRTGTGVEVRRQAKFWSGSLYLKFSFANLATYSASAPQGVFMGSMGPRIFILYGGALVLCYSFLRVRY
jgi:hypothetical protein